LSDHLYWTLGGEHPIEKDYFYGKMDDLRFYANSLSEDQMLAISNDDITGKSTVGFRKQVIYDEGSATNGFTLVNDEGTLRALVIENETAIEVRTTRLIENTANDLPFTPLQKDDWDLSLWLDAADLTSMDQGSSPGAVGPPGNGASVGFWQDKSGSGHHAVKVSGNPQYQVQSFNNSFPCIEPNGGYFEISNSATEMDQLSAFTFVTAFKWTNTSTGDKLMYKGATGWHRNFATFYIGKFNTGAGQGTGFWVAENGTRDKMDGNSNTDARDQSKIFVIKYDGSGPNATFYINGDQERFYNMNSAWTQLPSTPSDSIHVGGNYQIAELLFFEKALEDDDRKKIEGYVAHKTGLNGDLFYTHPYFSNPPPGSSELKKANEIDTNWHHVAVSYGENPKTLKLYLDGQLADEPVVSTASGLIPSHPDIPSVGAPQGSFYLPDFGSFLGTLDDIRVYDRGLSASEIAQVFAGDANQTGLVEYRVVEKPQIQTLPAMEARPDSVILRANLSSIGGEIIESEVTLGEEFDQDTIPGIQAWFDADQIDAQNGASLTKWQDQSGRPSQDRSFTNAQGSPRLLSFALKGNPVVSFDGEDDLMWTGYDFNSLLHQTGYTMVTLARFSGGENNRVITSRNNDFYFGFHADGVGLWRAGGNISPFGDRPDSQWHLHLGTISDNTGDPRASFWQDGILKVQDSLASDNQNFGPGQLQVGGVGTNYSSCEIAEILIYSQELNSYHRSILEGYLAHKWNLVDEVLPSTHPYRDLDPFGLQVSQTTSVSVGGDPAEVIIFWGDEKIETLSTSTDPDNNSTWDYATTLSDSADIGALEKTISENLIADKEYYFRAYARNVAGETWADQIQTFKTIDTQFTAYSMDGLILWLDASDVDGNGERDQIPDQTNIPLWVDKSTSAKDATQTIIDQMPSYDRSGFGSLPSVRFTSGQSLKVGILSNLSGPLNIFASAYGDGVIIGGDDGQYPWTLDARSYNWLNVFRGENEALQQITLGLDPRTNLGMLTGSIGEILVFDRLLEPFEREMVEGYLAHKWGLLEDLAESGFAVNQGLVLYYPFNETGGSVVEDYSETLRHAMVIDADLNTEGKFTSGIGFDSIDPANAKIDLDYNELSMTQDNWTVSTWFQYPIHNADADEYVVYFADGTSFPVFYVGDEQFVMDGISDSDFE
ncbi:MAG: LamG-like jellyroll fold domain-containing protein, partial [Opitutales bacterium]